MNLAFFFLSIAPAALVVLALFNKQQKIQKDFSFYLATLFLGSFVTMRLALFANGFIFSYTNLDFGGLDEDLLFYTAFAGIGFNEEMAKLLPILFLLYASNRWQSKSDVFFSCLFIGAFFAAFENLFVPTYSSLLGSLLLRSFIAVPAHLSFACIMAYFINLAFNCSTKKDFLLDKSRASIISWFMQAILFSKFSYYFFQQRGVSSSYNQWMLISCVLMLLLLLLEITLIFSNRNKYSWLLGWNLRLNYMIMALVVPASMHGLHDWGCSRFTGQHLLMFYICLFMTYTTIIVASYFILNKQAKVVATLKPTRVEIA